MKLSKLLTAIRGKAFASNTDIKYESIITVPAKPQPTPIYDSYHTSNHDSPSPLARVIDIPSNKPSSSPAVPSPTSPQPSPIEQPLLVPLSHNQTVIEEKHCKPAIIFRPYRPHRCTSLGLKTHYTEEPDKRQLIVAPQPISVGHALLALPAIEESITEDENVYELAAGRRSTSSLSAETSQETSTTGQSAIASKHSRPKKSVGFVEEEMNRLSHESERQQVQIHNLKEQLEFADRKVQSLQAGKLPYRRKLKKRVVKLVDEIQLKEEEVKKWVDIHQKSVQEAQSTAALQAIRDDMKTSACLLRDICDDLRVQMREVERKGRLLDRKTKRQAIGWIEDEFEELCYRLTEGSSDDD